MHEKIKNDLNKLDLSGFDNLSLTSTMSSARVNVWHDGPNLEWSFAAPDYITTDDNALLNGCYTTSNLITLFDVMPEIFAPINEIATRVSSLKFILRRHADDEIIWDNANFNKLFSQPNPLMDFKTHIWQAVVYDILVGASFQFINKPQLLSAGFDQIRSLINIPSDKVVIEPDKAADPYTSTDIKDFIKSVFIKKPHNQKREFDIDSLIMLLHPDLSKGNQVDKWKSQLSGAQAAIGNLIPVYIARRQIYLKRGALGFIVSKKTDSTGSVALTNREKIQMNQEFQRGYGVTGQHSLFPTMSNPVDFVKTSASIQEMQPFDETEMDARAIYAVLRVPKHLCPTKGNSTFSNADADLKTFYTDVIIPKGNHLAQMYTTHLGLEEIGLYVDIDSSGVEILQSNKKDEAETSRTNGEVYEKRFKNGVCTLNEWVVAAGGEMSANPLYDKRLFEMTPQESEFVKNLISTSTPKAF